MTRQAKSSSPAAWSASDLAENPHAAADKADRVRAMFAAIADRYDLNNRVHSLWRDQAWRRKAVALCHVQPADRVLDVACGTGDLAEAFARAGAASVRGVDFTEQMRDVVLEAPTIHKIHEIARQGLFMTLQQFGFQLVSQGVTAFDEIEKVAGSE